MFYFIRYSFLYLVVSAICLGSSQQQSEHQFIEYGRFLVTMTTKFNAISSLISIQALVSCLISVFTQK